MSDLTPPSAPRPEWVTNDHDGGEVAVREGVVLRSGLVAVSSHDVEGEGNTSYLRSEKAREMAAEILNVCDEIEARRV